MKKYILYFTIAIISSSFVGCSRFSYLQGNREFDNMQYSDAIQHFNKVDVKSNNKDAKIKLANCYRLINDIEKAKPLFKEVVNFSDSKPINMFYYAKILMTSGDYSNASIWFKKYLAKVPNDMVAQMLLTSCNSANTFKYDTTMFTLNVIKFPEFESIFGESPYKGGVVFAGDKKAEKNSKKDAWSGNTYYDIYYTEKDKDGHWLSPELLKGEINGSYHEGPATFNKAGDVVYFTRSNYSKKKLLKSSKDVNNLKLFKAKLVNDKWEQLEEMPFNSNEYSVGQPCLSEDEKTLYFISDMPGGLGGTDIYSSTFDGKTWNKPQNLGKEINTQGNEMFPFVSPEGTFYFSSDAHLNLGGLDVFYTSYDIKNKKWLPVKNLNYPLNSSFDDFAFILNKDGKAGFITSNRENADNMYEFAKNDPSFGLSGLITMKGTNSPLEGATITVVNNSNGATNNNLVIKTDKEGRYAIKLEPNIDYVISASKENYVRQSIDLSTKSRSYSENFAGNFELDKLTFNISGVVVEKGKDTPLAEATITITDETTGSSNKITAVTDQKGKYQVKLEAGIDYLVGCSKENYSISEENYFNRKAEVSTKYKFSAEDFVRNFELDKIVIDKPVIVENVYYDLGKSTIRRDAAPELDKLVQLLNENPNIEIEIGSHTDSRAGDQYNLSLSEKRAKAVVDYLVLKGIDRNRLTSKGYGETQLVNHCINIVKCAEEEHQKNRRTEFKVIKISQPGFSNISK